LNNKELIIKNLKNSQKILINSNLKTFDQTIKENNKAKNKMAGMKILFFIILKSEWNILIRSGCPVLPAWLTADREGYLLMVNY
jgi:hypothetical protein